MCLQIIYTDVLHIKKITNIQLSEKEFNDLYYGDEVKLLWRIGL